MGEIEIEEIHIIKEIVETIGTTKLFRLFKKWGVTPERKRGTPFEIFIRTVQHPTEEQIKDLFLAWEHYNFKKITWKMEKVEEYSKKRLPPSKKINRAEIIFYNVDPHTILAVVEKPKTMKIEGSTKIIKVKTFEKSYFLFMEDLRLFLYSIDSSSDLVNTVKATIGITSKPYKIPPYKLKAMARSKKLIRLTINATTSGVAGISKIIVEGDDVLTALKWLAVRQNIDLSRAGYWEMLEFPDMLIGKDGIIRTDSTKLRKVLEFLEKEE